MNRGQRGKLAMATAALAIGLLSLTGCGYINAQQTTEQYSSSDGTRTDLGPLQLRSSHGGIQLDGTTAVADPRVQLVGYGPSASTIGANRAGRAAAVAVRRRLERLVGGSAA